MKKILSICLIVKNEEACLSRCLDSLQPLLTELDAELIITDTGSTDKTVEIAKKYTDQVHFFAWCDDFSAARNDGVDRATGEWILSLDADEWFENLDEMIRFFKSGECKKYKSASYLIRNYSDLQRKIYTESTVVRLFYRTKGTRYKGAIHEFIPLKNPLKVLSCFVHHTGYLHEQTTDLLKKHQRNLIPLLKELEKAPDDLRNLYHVLQEYESVQDWDHALAYEEQALQAMQKSKDSPYREEIYKFMAWAKIKTEQWAEAEQTIQEYFSENHRFNVLDLDMWNLMVRVCQAQKKWKSTIEAAAQYFRLYANYVDGTEKEKTPLIGTVMSGTSRYYVNLVQLAMSEMVGDAACDDLLRFFKLVKSSAVGVLTHKEQQILVSSFSSCCELLIRNSMIALEQRSQLFDSYVDEWWSNTEKLYNPILFDSAYLDSLPGMARFSYYAKAAKDSCEEGLQGNINYLKTLTEAARMNPVIVPFIKECLEQTEATLQEEQSLNKANESSPSELSEFEQLGIMVKAQIQQFLETGKMEEARQILGQYETLNPSDPEIRILWKTVNGNGLMN